MCIEFLLDLDIKSVRSSSPLLAAKLTNSLTIGCMSNMIMNKVVGGMKVICFLLLSCILQLATFSSSD